MEHLINYMCTHSSLLIRWMSYSILVLAVYTLVALSLFINAPYGKFVSDKFGKKINAKVVWFVQEAPSLCTPLFVLSMSDCANMDNSWANWLTTGGFICHYFQRTVIYSYLMPSTSRPVPLFVFLCAVIFTSVNGLLQSVYFASVNYPPSYHQSPQFVIGMIMFVAGMVINIHSDHVLRSLRKPGDSRYYIPKGGFFAYITAANYFGEIVEWIGFAVATTSLNGLAFALYTMSNLIPRAFAQHRWYMEKFKDTYPKDRKIIIPFIC